MFHARLNAATGRLSDASLRPATYPDDVPLVAMPTGFGPWAYDAVNKLAVSAARQKRTLHAIWSDVNALTGPQKVAIWSDLVSGSPPKLSLDTGPNASGIFLLWRLAVQDALGSTFTNDMRATAIAYYVQDTPSYLVHPAFAPSINIPGDEPAP